MVVCQAYMTTRKQLKFLTTKCFLHIAASCSPSDWDRLHDGKHITVSCHIHHLLDQVVTSNFYIVCFSL